MSDTERESSDSDPVFHGQPEEADLRWQPMHWEVPRAPRSKHRALGKQGGAHRDTHVDRALGMAGIWPSRRGMGTLDNKSDLSVGPGWDRECSCPAGALFAVSREPGGPVDKNLLCNMGNSSSVPGWELRPHTSRGS